MENKSATQCICTINRYFTQTYALTFRCPECRRDTVLPDGGIGKLSTNFRLMSLQDQVASQEQEQNGKIDNIKLAQDIHVSCDSNFTSAKITMVWWTM